MSTYESDLRGLVSRHGATTVGIAIRAVYALDLRFDEALKMSDPMERKKALYKLEASLPLISQLLEAAFRDAPPEGSDFSLLDLRYASRVYENIAMSISNYQTITDGEVLSN